MIVLQACLGDVVPRTYVGYMEQWRQWSIANGCRYVKIVEVPEAALRNYKYLEAVANHIRIEWAVDHPDLLWVDWDIEPHQTFIKPAGSEPICDSIDPEAIFYTGSCNIYRAIRGEYHNYCTVTPTFYLEYSRLHKIWMAHLHEFKFFDRLTYTHHRS
jgi:hypothetical protein